jgi:hypothetical protein
MDVPNKPNAILNFNKSKFKVFAFKARPDLSFFRDIRIFNRN